MVNNDNTPTSESAKTPDVKQSDLLFIWECVKAIDTDGKVDLSAVTQAMGTTNHNATRNRLNKIKKEHGLNNLQSKSGFMGSIEYSKAKSQAIASDTDSASPKTKSPSKVAKVNDKKTSNGTKAAMSPKKKSALLDTVSTLASTQKEIMDLSEDL